MVNHPPPRATCETYEEYCDPGQSDVVKGYGPLKGIPSQLGAISVVLVPINTRRVCGCIWGESNRRR